MITYIVEFSILHLLFFGIYKVMLSKETQLGFLRFFLLGSTLLSLILPAIEIPTKTAIPTFNTEAIVLPIISATPQETGWDIPWYVVVIGIVSIIFTFKLLLNLIQIYGWYRQSETDAFDQINIQKVTGLQNSFTFFKWIFIDPKNFENPADIIRHEQGHASKLHSLDLLIFHILTIFFWWQPSVWLMINELKAVHEFEADEFALRINDSTYTKTLVQCTLKAHGMDLASSFDDAPIFNRLNFIKKMKKKISIWKVASIATLVAISGAMFACEDELDSEIKRIADESNQQIDYSDDVQIALEKLTKENPGSKYVVIETKFENEESIKKLNSYDPEQIAAIFVNEKGDDKSVTMIVNQSSALFNKTIEVQETSDDVFTIVENAATFPGGLNAFKSYLKENIKYPKQAKRLGVEGKVFVGFIVEEDGELTNMEVLRGIGAGCDAEALRVLEESPRWEPGSQNGKTVRQKMVSPVEFTLTD
ncbi:TonB family protein [Ekhidna sp. To15]|uniref:TonB family protein n=1 Tax=Ekhidna sp. To15 TaxID=3395267 RepID=UPI003F5255C1